MNKPFFTFGVVGSRDYPEEFRHAISGFVESLPFYSKVVSGGAGGVDRWAVDAASAWSLKYKEFLPAFQKKGTRRRVQDYFDRNQEIVDNSDIIIAFIYNGSRGTLDTIFRAAKKKPCFVVPFPWSAKWRDGTVEISKVEKSSV